MECISQYSKVRKMARKMKETALQGASGKGSHHLLTTEKPGWMHCLLFRPVVALLLLPTPPTDNRQALARSSGDLPPGSCSGEAAPYRLQDSRHPLDFPRNLCYSVTGNCICCGPIGRGSDGRRAAAPGDLFQNTHENTHEKTMKHRPYLCGRGSRRDDTEASCGEILLSFWFSGWFLWQAEDTRRKTARRRMTGP